MKNYTTKSGKKRVWYSPKDKVERYCQEKQANVSSATGSPLTKEQKAYRDGYIKAHQEHTTLFLLKNGQKDKVRSWQDKKRKKREEYKKNKKK